MNQDHSKNKKQQKRSSSSQQRQNKYKMSKKTKKRFNSYSRSRSSSSSHRRKSKQKRPRKQKTKIEKQRIYLTSFSNESSNKSKSKQRSRSRSKQRHRKRDKRQQGQRYRIKGVMENTKERPKINGNFLSSLIVGHRVQNKKLDEEDIQKAGQKLQKNFNETRRPVTMSQYLSNETLRIAPLNRQQDKIYICELQKCKKQFQTIEQLQKHIQKHKQDI